MFDWLFPKAKPKSEIERRIDALEVEWEEWFDKFRTLYARISRRVERLQQLENAPEPPTTDDPRSARPMTDERVRRINDQILARRRGHAVSNGEG